LVSEPAARSIHAVHAEAAASAITAQRRRVRRASGSREPCFWECISSLPARRHTLPAPLQDHDFRPEV
jgi:hypothetical protein